MAVRHQNRFKKQWDLSHLGICDRVLQKLFEVLIPFLVLVTCLSPLSNCFTVENEDVEEGVKEENDVRFDRNTVE